MTTYADAIEDIAIRNIIPPHEVRDETKLAAISASMFANGWQGRPLLVVETQGLYQAITGSHRYAAAANLWDENETLPCIVVDHDKLDGYDYDSREFYDDDHTLAILEEIGDENAYALMSEENEEA